MMTWIARQTELKTAQFDGAIRAHYPESAHFFEDPAEFHRGLKELWNYLDATNLIDWDQALAPKSVCLDLGGGVGWLSAVLSKSSRVEKIYLLDTSKFFLKTMKPGIEKLMGAQSEKIEPVEGFFTPLLFDDRSLDAVMASSSLHHADQLEDVLREVHRVLKDDGTFFILNELPHSAAGYLGMLVKSFLAIFVRTLCRVYKPVSRAISSSGALDDPFLGDRRYPLWYWRRAIANAGFRIVRFIPTGMVTLKAKSRGMELTHFVCKKIRPGDSRE